MNIFTVEDKQVETVRTRLFIRFSGVGKFGVLCPLSNPALVLHPPIKPGISLLAPGSAPGVADLEPVWSVSYHHHRVIWLNMGEMCCTVLGGS